MKKKLFVILNFVALISFSQSPTQAFSLTAGAIGATTADSSNYYAVDVTNGKIYQVDPLNSASVITTMTASTSNMSSVMIFNTGKGIYGVYKGLAGGSPVYLYYLFNGTSTDTLFRSNAGMFMDRILIGNAVYFKTTQKIFRSDLSSVASVQTMYTAPSANANSGINEWWRLGNSLVFTELNANTFKYYLKRLDLSTNSVLTIDSAQTFSTLRHQDEVYFTDPYKFGNGKVKKVDAAGNVTVLYTENGSNADVTGVLGVTANGVLALRFSGSKYILVNIGNGTTSDLNFNTTTDPFPTGMSTAKSLSPYVYFQAYDTVSSVLPNLSALWVTDGTLPGTRKLIAAKTPSQQINFSPCSNNQLHFVEACNNGLWIGNNTNELIYVKASSNTVQHYAGFAGTYGLFPLNDHTIGFTAAVAGNKGVYKITCSPVSGIDEFSGTTSLFDLFPNPARDKFTLLLNTGTESAARLQIRDCLGRVHREADVSSGTTVIDLGHLTTGLYFVSVTGNGFAASRKLIVD